MKIVIDTSVVISIITNEAHKKQIMRITKETDLIAPLSLNLGDRKYLFCNVQAKKNFFESGVKSIIRMQKISCHFIGA